MIKKSIIKAGDKRFFPDLRELVDYKDLFITLSMRDIRVRYAQAFLGLLWALLQPLVSVVILYVVFVKFVEVDTGEIPPLLFIACGQALWTYFSFVMSNAGNSIIASQDMVKKIYFPRLIIPLSKATTGLVDFSISLAILICLMVFYGFAPKGTFLLSLLFLLIGVIAALSIGIWLSALTIRFRDFQHIIPFMVQLGTYITPIAYPAAFARTQLPEWASALYFLNPMAGTIEGFRWALLGGTPPDAYSFISFGIVLLLFFSGLYYFSKIESKMADLV